ncbi:MAG: hypothetical protein AAGF87_05410 [Bacteroidota bacterium]
MDGKGIIDKQVFLIGSCAYFILAVLSQVYFLERTAFTDMAFHIFELIRTEELAIQNFRFGAAFTQAVVLLGVKMDLSLETILRMYSLCFVAFQYVVFLVCIRWLKNPWFGMVLILLNTLMVAHSFYWPISEFPQGLAYLMLYFGLIHSWVNGYIKDRKLLYPLAGILIITGSWCHPLTMFPFLFTSLFLCLHDKKMVKINLLGVLVFAAGIYIKASYFKNSTDSDNVSRALEYFVNQFPDYFSQTSHKIFWQYLLKDYYLLGIFLLLSLGAYIWHKRFWKAALLFSFFFGYLMMVNLSYPEGADQFYAENQYLSLGIFVSVCMALDLSAWSGLKKLPWLLGGIVFIRLLHIGFSNGPYSGRIDYLRQVMNETSTSEQKKIIAPEQLFSMEILKMTWATAYENWIISTVESDETRSVFLTDNIAGQYWTGDDYNHRFITVFGAFDYSDLPNRYFIFSDSTMYQRLDSWPLEDSDN